MRILLAILALVLMHSAGASAVPDRGTTIEGGTVGDLPCSVLPQAADPVHHPAEPAVGTAQVLTVRVPATTCNQRGR